MIGHAIQATVYNLDGDPVIVDAFTTATPGVVTHASLGRTGWVVSHERSGLFIAGFDDPEQAKIFAAALGAIADWTLTGTEIRHTVGDFGKTVKRIAADLGESFSRKSGAHPVRDERMST